MEDWRLKCILELMMEERSNRIRVKFQETNYKLQISSNDQLPNTYSSPEVNSSLEL
jgi:hypothetical protein